MLHDPNTKAIFARCSVTTLIISFLTVLLGVGCIFLFNHVKTNSTDLGSHYWLLIFFAICFIIGGIGGFFWGPKDYYHKALNARVYCYSIYFKRGSETMVLEALSNNNFQALDNLRDNDKMGIRLDIVSTRKRDYVRYRLYELVGYDSKPISDILTMDRASANYFLDGSKTI